jgi:hypothetical protein
VGILGEQAVEVEQGIAGRRLIAVGRTHLPLSTEGRAKNRVRNPLVSGVKVRKIPVVRQRLIVLPVFEVGISDLQLCLDREVAVRVVVNDRLERLDCLGVVDHPEEDPRATFERVDCLAVQLVRRRHILKGGRVGCASCSDKQGDGGERGRAVVHACPECVANHRILSIRVDLLKFSIQ